MEKVNSVLLRGAGVGEASSLASGVLGGSDRDQSRPTRVAWRATSHSRLQVGVSVDVQLRGVGRNALGHGLEQAKEVVAHIQEILAASGEHALHVAAEVVLGKRQVTGFVAQDALAQVGPQRIGLGQAEGAIEVFGDDVADQDAPHPVGSVALS